MLVVINVIRNHETDMLHLIITYLKFMETGDANNYDLY